MLWPLMLLVYLNDCQFAQTVQPICRSQKHNYQQRTLMGRSGTNSADVRRMVATQQLGIGFTDQYQLHSSCLETFPTQGGRDSWMARC